MSDIDLTPEPEEIVQAEDHDDRNYSPVKVAVCGPTEVRELPAIRAGYFTALGVSPTTAVQLLAFEPRRKSAVILSKDKAIWLAATQSGAQLGASSAFYVPASTPFTIEHLDQVWACATEETTDISVMTNFWSE